MKWKAHCRKLAENAVYRLACVLGKQNQILLLSSSPNDLFNNISALAQKLREQNIPHCVLHRAQEKKNSLRLIIALARAKVIVIDAASPFSRIHPHKNTILIHCWHAGGAYKKVGFHALRPHWDVLSEEKRIQRIHSGIGYFVCSSQETAKIYAQAFRLPLEKMLVLGIPRMDSILLRPNKEAPQTYTILYAPTYRSNVQNQRRMPILPNVQALKAKLSKALGEAVRFVFRSHPTVPKECLEDLNGLEDWSALPQEEALSRTSVLVTDYSSIFFDFLPFARPIVFYVPDLEDYQRNERPLYFSPYAVFPESTCADEESLLQTLIACRHKKVHYEKIWQEQMAACDGHSSERLTAFIESLMKGKTQ